jgi:hypothetical protein
MDQVATPDTKNKEMTSEERTTMENMVTGMAEMAEMLRETNELKTKIAESKQKRKLEAAQHQMKQKLETEQHQTELARQEVANLDMMRKRDEMRLGNAELVSNHNVY